MANFTLTITKSDIYEEVAKTTAYIGGKNLDKNGKSLYDQVFVTEADLEMIDRFFNESLNLLINVLKRFILGDSVGDRLITFILEMPSRFDGNLINSISLSANSFIVNSIIGKWCEITANDKVKEYKDNAAALLLDIKDKTYYKKKPTRTKIS
jgi:hypothetical protein